MQTARNACDRSSEMAMATIRVTTSGQRSSILAIVALFLLLPSAAEERSGFSL